MEQHIDLVLADNCLPQENFVIHHISAASHDICAVEMTRWLLVVHESFV